MRVLKMLLLGVIIGALAGLWVGFNLGRDKPWYSNPFADREVQDKLKSSVGEGVEKAGESIEKMGEDMKGQMKN